MTFCSIENLQLPRLNNKQLSVNFTGGNISSDGGLLPISLLDKKLKITSDISKVLKPFDIRDKSKVKHKVIDMIKQRVYGIISGNEDLNDHNDLRKDELLKTLLGKDSDLAGSSTLCRFENNSCREACVEISKIFVEKFIESFATPPEELILDFDATDDEIHGHQEGKFFQGYYDHYCFLPLYVFCNDQLLVSYLRPSNIDGAKHSLAILSLLVKRIRQVWPKVRIIFRADSGFCRWRLLSWCERNNVEYIIGISSNKRLERFSSRIAVKSRKKFNRTRKKAKIYSEIYYSADTWKKIRRKVIVKAEHNEKGKNTRYVITNINGNPKFLYEKIYCMRGDMENRIKEQQLDLFADRTSCHGWWANQFRLLLASAAYIIMERFRALALKGTFVAKAQCSTIRTKLIKIGTLVKINSRKIYIKLSSSFTCKDTFITLLNNILLF